MKKLNRQFPSSVVMLAMISIGTARAMLAQAPGPPDGMQPPPNMQPQKMNVDKELNKMSKRYGLSDAQKTQIRPILEDTQHKLEALFQDSSMAPDERFSKMRGIHEDQVSRISAILSDAQRSKYQKDQQRMPGDMGPGGPPPPGQDDDASGPPAPQ
jgi:Spy/CpxP family protein refolding chaperone